MAIIDMKANPIRTGPSNMSFNDLRTELERQIDSKQDISVLDKNVKMYASEGYASVEIPEYGEYEMTDIFHHHVSQNLSIPYKYYNRMLIEAPELLAENVNTWLQKSDKLNIIRILDDMARAWVSSAYGFYDNLGFYYAIAKAIIQAGGTFIQVYLDDYQMVLKAVQRDLEMQMKNAELGTVFPAVFCRNSEVRYTRLRVSATLVWVICWNGTIGENSIEQIHRGARTKIHGILKQSTIQKENEVFWEKVEAVIVNTFDQEKFEEWIKMIDPATEYKLEQPTKVLEGMVVEYDIPESEKDQIFDYFAKQGDATQFGAVQAMTWYAHEQSNIDRQIELETKANELLLTDGKKFEKALIKASQSKKKEK